MTTTETTTTDTTEETYQPSTVYHAPPHSHPPATPPPHPLGPYPRNDPRITYLCVFYHRLLDFRVPEAHAVLQLLAGEHGFELWPATQHPLTPYYYLRIDPVHIPAFTQRCMLVRAVYELWAQGSTRHDIHTALRAIPDPMLISALPPATARVRMDLELLGFGVRDNEKRVALIHECLGCLSTTCPVDLRNPTDQLAMLLVQPAIHLGLQDIPPSAFFGRLVAEGQLGAWMKRFALHDRRYLGPTSMDTIMSFVMANMGQARKGSLSIDPCAGTGGIMIAIAALGGHVMGADIDMRVIKLGKVDKNGQQVNVWSNFRDYNLPSPVALLRCDLHRNPWRTGLREVFDSIVCDPPYGVRAGGRKSQARVLKTPPGPGHRPATVEYMQAECLHDLLHFAARVLRVGGRLVFFMAIAPELYSPEEVPTHPVLSLVSLSEQVLSTRYSRVLVTLVKHKPLDEDEEAAFHASHAQNRSSIDRIHELVFSQREVGEDGVPLDAAGAPVAKKHGRSKQI